MKRHRAVSLVSWFAGAFAVLGYACSSDLAVPEEAQLGCVSEADCPAAWTCNTNTKRCVKTANLDMVSPGVTQKSVSPSLAKKGTEVRAVFEVDEALSKTPDVVVDLRGTRAAMTFDTAKSNDRHFEFSYIPKGAGSEPEATFQVLATLSDKAGNLSKDIVLGTVAFDFTAPKLVSARVSAPFAKVGDVVTYLVTPDEPLDVAPDVRVGRGGGTETLKFSLQEGTSYLFTHTVAAGEADGEYSITVGLRDLAGNEAAGLAGDSFTLDASPVQIGWSATDSPFYSARPGHNTVKLVVMTDEDFDTPPARFSVTIAGNPMDCGKYDSGMGGYNCTYTVSGDEPEGAAAITIEAADAAGNRGTANSDPVTFDFSRPRPVGVTIVREPAFVPSADRENEVFYFSPADPFTGEAVRIGVFVYANEAIVGTPVLKTKPQDLGFVDQGSSGTTAAFGNELDGTEAEGSYSFEITWKDELDNEGTISIPNPTIVVDATPPDPAASLDLSKVLYKRVPWGSDATGGVPRFSVSAEGGAIKETADVETVLVYRTDAPSAGTLIGNTNIDKVNGSFSIAELTGGDLPEVFLSLTDRAGARSAPVEVTEVAWVATLGGKVPGNTFENPHRFELHKRLILP